MDFAQITAVKFNLSIGNQTGVPRVANMMNMKSRTKWILAFFLAVAVLFGIKTADSLAQKASGDKDTAVFSGGCFWGVDAVFKHVKGVTKVVSGYAGGAANTAQYETVSTGTTGHAESVQVTYDPSKVSYDDLLKVFFFVAHDPTELNRQGPDSGTQYRSSIFYENDAQKKMAVDYIAQLDQKRAFSKPIVTKVVPFTGFYPAEAYHQNYLELHPDQPYIVFNDLPKLDQFQKDLPGLYQQQAAK
ncbi:MAG TPA: peptide-methionine (S)-S-oxide reductase MsrA [Candidatus Limnocylindrales bacterium]|nr:peptide-methionine (S)-S-oxide reductase MsrA [Candidatus Limnocylindrales bacterium]